MNNALKDDLSLELFSGVYNEALSKDASLFLTNMEETFKDFRKEDLPKVFIVIGAFVDTYFKLNPAERNSIKECFSHGLFTISGN